MIPLPRQQEVGLQARLLGGEERAGAPEARGHLVADQEHVVASARLADLAQIRGGGHQHARRTLDERFEHDGGQLGSVGLDGRAGLGRPAGVGVAGRAQDREAERLEDRAEDSAVAERERADRVAVVRVAQGEEAGAPRCGRIGSAPVMTRVVAPVDPILEGDLEGLLDGDGAVGREEEVGLVDGDHGSERLGQLDHGRVAVAEHGGVGDLGRLRGEGPVEFGDVVAEGVDPEGGNRIEVAVAVGVDQLPALGPVDDQRGAAGVGRHLGEAVPDHGGIPLYPGGGGARGSSRGGIGGHGPILDATGRPGQWTPSARMASWT